MIYEKYKWLNDSTLERSQLLKQRLKEVNNLKLSLLSGNEFERFMTRTLKKFRRRAFLLFAEANL